MPKKPAPVRRPASGEARQDQGPIRRPAPGEARPDQRPRGRPAVAVVGASRDRSKFGNISVRAHRKAGYDVYPVNLNDAEIEGLRVYRSVLDIPVDLDRITVYLPPSVGLTVLPEIARKGTKELYFNPGAESQELVETARRLGLKPLLACSIVDLGMSPSDVD